MLDAGKNVNTTGVVQDATQGPKAHRAALKGRDVFKTNPVSTCAGKIAMGKPCSPIQKTKDGEGPLILRVAQVETPQQRLKEALGSSKIRALARKAKDKVKGNLKQRVEKVKKMRGWDQDWKSLKKQCSMEFVLDFMWCRNKPCVPSGAMLSKPITTRLIDKPAKFTAQEYEKKCRKWFVVHDAVLRGAVSVASALQVADLLGQVDIERSNCHYAPAKKPTPGSLYGTCHMGCFDGKGKKCQHISHEKCKGTKGSTHTSRTKKGGFLQSVHSLRKKATKVKGSEKGGKDN